MSCASSPQGTNPILSDVSARLVGAFRHPENEPGAPSQPMQSACGVYGRQVIRRLKRADIQVCPASAIPDLTRSSASRASLPPRARRAARWRHFLGFVLVAQGDRGAEFPFEFAFSGVRGLELAGGGLGFALSSRRSCARAP